MKNSEYKLSIYSILLYNIYIVIYSIYNEVRNNYRLNAKSMIRSDIFSHILFIHEG